MKISYDEDADVLYLVFRSSSRPVAYIETQEELILRVEEETNTILSITIPHLSMRKS